MTGTERLREVSDAIQYGIKLRDVVEFGYARDHRDEASLDLDDVLWDIADQIKREHAEALDRAKSARQTSVSAYDLLPQEDCEAIEFVREHGGLNEVRLSCLAADNRRVDLCAALGIDLATGWSDAMDVMRNRLMPEVPDSWEWLEEDSGKNPFDYCKDVGHRLDTFENSETYKARDLVRRAKALAETEREQ